MKEWKTWIEKIKEIGYLRLGLLVLAGVVLLVLSIPQSEESNETTIEEVKRQEKEELEEYVSKMEDKLTQVLSQVEGIGKVKVMITAKSTKEEVVLKDVPFERKETKEQDSEGGNRENTEYSSQETTVLEKQTDGEENPYITKEVQPEMEGVLVIAQGAGDKKIVSEISEAVTALFSVPSHKIKVMKMK